MKRVLWLSIPILLSSVFGSSAYAQGANWPTIAFNHTVEWEPSASSVGGLADLSSLVVLAHVIHVAPAKLIQVPHPLAGLPPVEHVVIDATIQVDSVLRAISNGKLTKGATLVVRTLGGTVVAPIPSQGGQVMTATQKADDSATFTEGEEILLFLGRSRYVQQTTLEDVWTTINEGFGKFTKQLDGGYLRSMMHYPAKAPLKIDLVTAIGTLMQHPYSP